MFLSCCSFPSYTVVAESPSSEAVGHGANRSGGGLVRCSPGFAGRGRQRGRWRDNSGRAGRDPAGGGRLGSAHARCGVRDLEERRQGR